MMVCQLAWAYSGFGLRFNFWLGGQALRFNIPASLIADIGRMRDVALMKKDRRRGGLVRHFLYLAYNKWCRSVPEFPEIRD